MAGLELMTTIPKDAMSTDNNELKLSYLSRPEVSGFLRVREKPRLRLPLPNEKSGHVVHALLPACLHCQGA